MEGLQDVLEVQRGIEGAREGAGELAELAFGAPCGTPVVSCQIHLKCVFWGG